MAQVQDELGPDFGPTGRLRLDHGRPRARHAGGAEGLRREPSAPISRAGASSPARRRWSARWRKRYGVAVTARGRWAGRPHSADHAGRQAWHDARPISRLPVRPRGVPARPSGAAARALTRIRDRVGRHRLAPAGARADQAPGGVSRHGGAADRCWARSACRRCSGVNRQTEELIRLQRKIAAYPPGAARHHRPSSTASPRRCWPRTSGCCRPRCASSPSSATTSTGCSSSPATRSSCWPGARRLRPLHRDRDPGRGAGRRRAGRRGAQGAAATRPGRWPTAWSA